MVSFLTAWLAALLFLHTSPLLVLGQLGQATNVERTYGIFGKIQDARRDKSTTVDVLLQECYSGFALNNCQDRNKTAKDHAFAIQFTDESLRRQQFCLQCCTRPVPRTTGADETWNLSCPLNDLQRLSVSQGQRVFRFARRETLEDQGVVECLMPPRTPGTFLSGYHMLLWIQEIASTFGTKYWRSVVNCSVEITESRDPPELFEEIIRIRSKPSQHIRATEWIAPTFIAIAVLIVLVSVPVFKGFVQKQRCCHCGSWMVVVNQLCIVCIIISCRLDPPPVKVYAENNGEPPQKPKRKKLVF